MRSVFFSPEPPIMIGIFDSGAGELIGVAHLIMLAVEAHLLVAQHRSNDLERLFQLLESVGEGAELIAE